MELGFHKRRRCIVDLLSKILFYVCFWIAGFYLHLSRLLNEWWLIVCRFVLQGLAADRVQSSTAKQLFVGKSPQVQSEFLTSTQGKLLSIFYCFLFFVYYFLREVMHNFLGFMTLLGNVVFSLIDVARRHACVLAFFLRKPIYWSNFSSWNSF